MRILISIQFLTISRSIAAFLFISLALLPAFHHFSIFLYLYACISDFLDGYLARRYKKTTRTGATLDLFSDKYLTIISLSYAIARDMPAMPCAVGILREVFLLSMRGILNNGDPLIPPQRLLGALTVIPIWGLTVILLLYPTKFNISFHALTISYWLIGVITLSNLIYKIIKNWKAIIDTFGIDKKN